MSEKTNLQNAVLRPEDLAKADHQILKRLLGEQGTGVGTCAGHQSHASGTGRGHSSYVSSMTPAEKAQKDA
jgi:hypothetical protein